MRIMLAQLAGWIPGERNAAMDLAPWVDEQIGNEGVQLVVLSELALSPYFPVSEERSWLLGGVTADSEALDELRAVAERRQTFLVVPFAERDDEGLLYNSATMLGPDGATVPCVRVSGPNAGRQRATYRKTHLSENRNTSPGVHEKYYFTPGDGLSVWNTPLGIIAPLICYDRSFPEAWRVVADAGASLVIIPVATSRPERVGMLEREISVEANHYGVFALVACKAGDEVIDEARVTYSGGSLVADPFGEIVGRAPRGEGDTTLFVDVDLHRLDEWRSTFHYRRDRRNDLYQTPKPDEIGEK